ncbi:MAG: hypothetical protein DCC75_01255 [Proteobacteria bacterium]|nr:MAG: hypothetical protein DCC75_01255 [Pseudomonadota bacterium]
MLWHSLWIRCAAALLALLPGAICADNGNTALRIGAVIPLSGSMSDIGHSLQASINYAQQEISRKIEVIYEDDQFQPKFTVAAVRKLLTRDRVQALIVFGSPTCLSVADELERQKVVAICISIHEKITQGKKYIFRVFASADALAATTAKEALKRDYRRVAVVSSISDGLLSVSTKFLEAFPKDRVTSHQQIAPSDTDVRAYATRVVFERPDSALLMLLPQHFYAVVLQLRSAGFKGDIFNAVTLSNTPIKNQIRSLAPDAWYVDVDNIAAAPIRQRIESRFDMELSDEGLLGHEALMLLSTVKDFGRAADELRAIRGYPGIFGKLTPQGQDFFLPVTVNNIH